MENHNIPDGDSKPYSQGSSHKNETRSKGIDNEKQAQRLIKGMRIVLDGRVTKAVNGKAGYEVEGESGTKYLVSEDFQACPCPDAERPCKHAWAARIELKAAEIRCDLEAGYESDYKKLEEKLKSLAEQNFKLRLQLEAFEALKEGFKKLLTAL